MLRAIPPSNPNGNSRLNRFRRYPRVRIAEPIACMLTPICTRRWLRIKGADQAIVHDLSVRGACISTTVPMKPGDAVKLSFRLPKQIQAADIAVATVRWTRDQFCGLSFTRLSSVSYGRLKKYVTINSQLSAAAGF